MTSVLYFGKMMKTRFTEAGRFAAQRCEDVYPPQEDEEDEPCESDYGGKFQPVLSGFVLSFFIIWACLAIYVAYYKFYFIPYGSIRDVSPCRLWRQYDQIKRARDAERNR